MAAENLAWPITMSALVLFLALLFLARWLALPGKSIVKPVGEVICIRKFPNFSDDTLTNQMLVCNVDVYSATGD